MISVPSAFFSESSLPILCISLHLRLQEEQRRATEQGKFGPLTVMKAADEFPRQR